MAGGRRENQAAYASYVPGMDAAIKDLSGREMSGRTLTVNEARPPRKREFGSGGPRFGDRQGGGGRNRFDGSDAGRKENQRPKRKIQELSSPIFPQNGSRRGQIATRALSLVDSSLTSRFKSLLF